MLERHDAPHILKGTQGTLRASFYVDGVLTDAGAGVTVTVTRLDGTALVTAQAATLASTGVYEYTLTPAQTAALDLLTVVWAGTFEGVAQTVTTYAEIVGGQLFSIAQARAWDNGAMASTSTYPSAAIQQAEADIAEGFEHYCGYPFYPRIGRSIFNGNGKYYASVPALFVRNVRALETRASGGVDYTAYTVDELADLFVDPNGMMIRETLGTFTYGARNVRATYEYGMTQPPGEITRAALMVLRDSLVPSNLTDRAFQLSDETGTYRLSTPGRNYPYGIPYVDAVLERHKAHALAVA